MIGKDFQTIKDIARTAGARLDLQPPTDERRDYGNGGGADERYLLISSKQDGGIDRAIDEICKCAEISFLRGDDGTVFKEGGVLVWYQDVVPL